MRRDLADFRSVFEVNVIGAFGSIQAFYPLVKVRRTAAALRAVPRPAHPADTAPQTSDAASSSCVYAVSKPTPCERGVMQHLAAHALGTSPCPVEAPDGARMTRSQAKQGGKKVVAVLSSGEASSISVSADAKDRGKPLAPMDVMQPAYRPSKAALNRRAALSADALSRRPPRHARSCL